jgi:NodT family efflux transporter outer membrane factor (OMF) lipoprotein
MLRRLRPLSTGLVLALAACSAVGPDYREPDVDWLADWQPALYGQARQEPGAGNLGRWWQRFGDPVLNDLVDKARRENPSLRIAGLRILESRALLGIARGLSYPQLQQVNASGTYVSQRRDGGGNDSEFHRGDAAFDLGWELDFWGRFRRGIESADAAYFASVTNYHDAQVLLAAQVASLYYGYKTTLQRIEIARNNVALQQRSLQITERLFRGGQDSELDLQQARTQYLATRATLPALALALTQQCNALAALLGRPPGALPELQAVDGSLPALDPVSLDSLPAGLLLRRPDVRSAAWRAAAQSAKVGVAKADLYPAISLGGSFGWTDNSLDGTSDVAIFAAGPALRWDLFNYGRIENNVRVQDARLQQALEGFQASVLDAAREIDNAASRIAHTGASQVILDDSLAAARRSLAIATRRYQEGYSDFQRVLDAQAATFAQSDRAIVNRGDHVAAIIDFYRALGGGWEAATIETVIPERTRETMRQRSDWGDLLDAELAQPTESGSPP